MARPPELPADGRAHAQVVAFAVDERGSPMRLVSPVLAADRGQLSPAISHGDGSTTWTLTAPSTRGDGKITLRVGETVAEVALRPAPPFRLEVPAPPPLMAGSNAPALVEVRLVDGAGAPVAGAELAATLAGGRVLGIDPAGPGIFHVRLLPPADPGRGSAALHVEVSALGAGAPRRVTLHPARAPSGKLVAEAWVDDDLELPVAGAKVSLAGPGRQIEGVTDRFGTAPIELPRPPERRFRVAARLPALPGVEATLDYLVVGGVAHAVPGVAGHGIVVGGEPPAIASLDVPLPLRPSGPVDVKLSVAPESRSPAFRVRVHLSDPNGKSLAGRIVYQASAGRLELVRPVEGGVAHLRFVPPPGAPRGSRFIVSVTEPDSGVTAFTEVVAQ
jgi:hypothetical protein